MGLQDHSMISSWQLDAFVDRMWDLSGPILNNMGFSGILGACAAAALKVRAHRAPASLATSSEAFILQYAAAPSELKITYSEDCLQDIFAS